ncbi:MAG: M56 family metallopeptidase [Lachnospiraceae bacterium]|nr:M56 family metallopeptidase [Lachnospiraceae bacterium]
MLEQIFLQFVEWSIPAAFMIGAILLVRGLFRRIPRQVICVLWIFAGLRLMIPISIESNFSLIPQKAASWMEELTATEAGENVSKTGEYKEEADTESYAGSKTENNEGIGTAADAKNSGTTGAVVGAEGAKDDGKVETVYPESNEGVASNQKDAASDNRGVTAGQSEMLRSDAEKSTVTVNGKQEEGKVNVVSVLAVIWVFGTVILLGYGLISYVRMRMRLRDAVHEEENIWLSDRIDTPFLMGVRARIYLPFSLKGQERSCVLAHERAHIARKDHITKLIGYLVLAVYWFSPFVWVAYVLLGRDIELACDERVVRTFGEQEKKNYAQVLLQSSIAPHVTKTKYVIGIPLAFGEVGVKSRIKGVLNYRKPGFWVLLCSVVLCVGLSIGFSLSPKTEESDDTNKQGESSVSGNEAVVPNQQAADEAAAAARAIVADMTVQVQDDTGMYTTKVIPDRMEPGSVIYFTDAGHYMVLAGGIYYDAEEKVESWKQEWLARIERAEANATIIAGLGEPKAQMVYSYDVDGVLRTSSAADTLEAAEKYAAEWYTGLFPMQYDEETNLVEAVGIPDVFAPHVAIYYEDETHFKFLASTHTTESYEAEPPMYPAKCVEAVEAAEAARYRYLTTEKPAQGTYVTYDSEGKLLTIRHNVEWLDYLGLERIRTAELHEQARTEPIVYEELKVTNPMTIRNEPGKGYLIDLNGDGVQEQLHISKWGVFVNGKISPYVVDSAMGVEYQADWWLIDIDSKDGMLELIFPADGSGGDCGVFHCDGTKLYNIGYVNFSYSEPSIINPIFLEDGTILCRNFIRPLEQMSLVTQMKLDEQDRLVIVEQEYEIEQEITLTLCEEISFFAERSMESDFVRVAPQKVWLTKTDGYEWTYLVAEDGSEGWVHYVSGWQVENKINGGKDAREVFEGFSTAG